MNARSPVFAGLVLISTIALAAEPAQLRTIDPLTLPAPTLLEPMRFAPDSRNPAEKIQPMLWEEALKRGSDAVLPIIVTLHEPLLVEHLRGTTVEADTYRVQWVASLAHRFADQAPALGMTAVRAISHFPILFGNVRASDLHRIAAAPNVRAVEFNAPLVAFRLQGSARMNSPTLRASHNATGAGVEVAVIDSGIFQHSEFASRIRAHQDLTGTTGDGTVDGSGHGTQVSGIIAGSQANGGVAPLAGLWAMKVLLDDGNGQVQWSIDALNSVYANRLLFGEVDVVNMSLGINGVWYNSDCDSSFVSYAAPINQLVAAGIPVFAASGNDFRLDGVGVPACLSNVISVGAVSDAAIGASDPGCSSSNFTAADQILCYSNSGIPLDILAPSACASTTATGGGTSLCFNGTSAASPYAAGVAAQILSVRPTTTPAQLKNALMTTGLPITDVNSITRRRIDAVQAYQALAGSGAACVPGPTTACVLNGRFKIEVQWTDFQAVTRNAFVASAGTSDTALFYWTNPNNWELLIKGINACSFNNKFWIYFAAATNVGYRVTVTDTQTGAAPKVYTNEVGNLAQATNDINAFSCP